MWPLLKAGGGSGTERNAAVVASLSARVASIGDNRLGGWHSYRSSKTALNQCMVFLFHDQLITVLLY
ncbi:short-chain dehydrogenase/reductase family protein [Trifolium medium]|uniref:Short-chain dehydrogenase/reductase family protein n=1 Tax=Trifolium medium TaxID=97028 RepID=A0A392Q4V2_9FABA|nr:short-chain dehydrogenase/reductase family protein [Trifolium medium]